MPGRAITIELPDDLYERLDRRAREAQRSLTAEVVYVLATSAPPDDRLTDELESELAAVALLNDDDLRRATRADFSARQSRRLQNLHFKMKDEGLTGEEQREEQQLMRAYERAMLIRAQALAELKRRGHDLAPFLVR